VINFLHEEYEDIDDGASFRKAEKQYTKVLKLAIGVLKNGELRRAYWCADDSLAKLLKYMPSIKDMKLILEPLYYLSKTKVETLNLDNSIGRHTYRSILQKRLIEYFLVKYSLKEYKNNDNTGTS
jgi:hypothetical protein